MPTILTKRSSTAGAAPTTLQLTEGELALNYRDRILYTLDHTGTVVTLGRPLNIQETTTAGVSLTWTKPQNASIVFVELQGAGGGGGGGTNSDTIGAGGSGGGGGCYTSAWFKASDLSATEAMVAGAGGSGGGAAAAGTSGSSSSFGSLLSAGGGGGGTAGAIYGASSVSGGCGGTAHLAIPPN